MALIVLLAGCHVESDDESHGTSSVKSNVGMPDGQLELRYVRTIIPELTASSALTSPTRLRVSPEGHFIWSEWEPPLLVFDSEGRFLLSFGPSGSGPGELGSSEDFDIDSSGNIYVYDNANRRISVFDERYVFQRSYPVETDNLKRISVDSKGNLYRLREAWYNGHFPAVVKHGPNGNKEAEWGEIPLSARIQASLVGGGIAVGEHVFYGYISDHRIWKTSLNGDEIAVFESRPNYYVESDGRILQEGEIPTSMIQYWRGLSRVKGLFLVDERRLVFQLVSTKVEGGYQTTLEVWHTDGYKVSSGTRTPDSQFLFDADENFMYFIGESEENQNQPIHVYEYYFPQRVKEAQQ